MLRRFVGFVCVLALSGSLVAGAQVKDKKDDKKVDKGTKAKITKIDADKKTIAVTTDAGKKLEVLVGKDTKFIGPRGGVSDEGLKDDRVAVGNEISVVLGADSKTAKEIHLPVRKSEKKPEKDKKPPVKDKPKTDK